MKITFAMDLLVNDEIRKELSGPFGSTMKISQIAKRVGREEEIFAVGDVTVSELLKKGYAPKIAVFDYRTERKSASFPEIRKSYSDPLRVKNPRGVLSLGLWKAVKAASRSKSSCGIRVLGEEDLASLACIYFAKNGTLVMYGLRGKGIVVIKVERRIKAYVARVLRRMKDIS